MKIKKPILHRRVSSKKNGSRPLRRRGFLVAALCALLTVGILLALGLTQFRLKGYLAQDGFAVPANSLSRLLKKAELGSVPLVAVDMGESVNTRGLNEKNYYIGEKKHAVSTGYPLFIQSGQVLYFLNDKLKLVTSDWGILDTYEGLYLSDGATFNADRSQADIQQVMLVQVERGYQLAKKLELKSNASQVSIPMNSICVFQLSHILFFSYENGVLTGDQVSVNNSDMITIGSTSSDYLTFLKKLGIWEDTINRPEHKQDPAPSEKDTSHEKTEPDQPEPPSELAPQTRPIVPTVTKKQPKEPKPGDPPSEVIEQPEDARENPDAIPSSPSPASGATDSNPSYQDPTVIFNKTITPWVYTLSLQATVADPARVLDRGIIIYVYEQTEKGDSQALRQVISVSGTIVLGQLKPDTHYRIAAEYSYHDKYNYPKKVSVEIGSARTLPFSELDPIDISFYDEYSIRPGSPEVDLFSDRLQLRDLLLQKVSNGCRTEVGGIINHPPVNLGMAETYINLFTLRVTDTESKDETVIKVDTAALRLLREGYTLTHWETEDLLKSGRSYTYSLELQDRYGNMFSLSGTTTGAGHTCKNAPQVTILVPDRNNVAGSAEIKVNWINPDAAYVSANSAENSAMGSEIIAGLYLVRQGDTLAPENAISLDAHLSGDETTSVSGAKFLPISANGNETSWIVTNLEVLKGYTCAVLCGHYDIEDRVNHLDETLEYPVNFITASLSELGTISYISEVNDITSNEANVSFRMNSANNRLLPLLDSVTLTLVSETDETEQSLTLRRDELRDVQISLYDGGNDDYSENVLIPLHLNGEETARYVPLDLSGQFSSILKDGQAPSNVWEYLLATSATSAADRCWLTIQLGGALTVSEGELPCTLLTLKPKTSYIGTFTTQADQGGHLHDVSNTSGQKVLFTTMNEEPLVSFENAFISTDSIELYGLAITDPDSCIRPDDADRGGSNVLIKIISANGVTVSSKYVNSIKPYDTLRISGLETNTTYDMVFCALKYQTHTTLELNRSLKYALPQNDEDPYRYTFTTGQSVTGDLALNSISQLYGNEDGSTTDSLSLLTKDDFYLGVWQNGVALSYANEEAKAAYLQMVPTVERGNNEAQTQEIIDLASGKGPLTMVLNSDPFMNNVWTTRLLPVQSGESYVIYNTDAYEYFRVTFYYRDNAGTLRCYGAWLTNPNYLRGGVFRIPTSVEGRNLLFDKVCYMRISGYYQQTAKSMILEKYDPHKTEDAVNLAENIDVVTGMYINTVNSLYFDKNYAYTDSYIPVTGGSVYELLGRDPNCGEDLALLCRNITYSSVFFYDAQYRYLGSYPLCNQTSLIKAPFGSAYCRFNLVMDQSGSEPVLNTANLSMKLYRAAITDRYLVTFQADLTDQSDTQILVGGSYTVSLSASTIAAEDSDDPEQLPYVDMGLSQTYDVTPDDLKDGTLQISRTIKIDNLNPNMCFMATLEIHPYGWENRAVLLDKVYFTTNRVMHTISNLRDLQAIRADPAGSYLVTADITGVTDTILLSDRPFTGTIDFQGHSVTSCSFNPLFYRISSSGVVKNLIYNYDALNTVSESYPSGKGTVAYFNYGTLQNIIVNYNADNQSYGLDIRYGGGIVNLNYGTIDHFIVQFMKDIRVFDYFGGISRDNYGSISNGYVCAAKITDNEVERYARLIHVWKDANGTILSSQTPNVAYGVGFNAHGASIENVYVIGDLVIQSADASTSRSSSDYQTGNAAFDPSTLCTNTAGILIGSNAGSVRNAFTIGDRLDFDPEENQWNYMLDRGPAVAHVSAQYMAQNINFFSYSPDPYSQYTSADSTVGNYNRQCEFESLRDYQWYESVLGSDLSNFTIRDNLDAGYCPQLILPDCFAANVQPLLEIPVGPDGLIKVLSNEVREQGVDAALVTVTLKFPYADNAQITGFTLVDRFNQAIECAVLAQYPVEDTYRVDVLLSLPENGSALADTLYTITGVQWTGGSQTFAGKASEREVSATFWAPVSSIADWTRIFTKSTGNIYGNYLLTKDLDFSLSATYTDWFCPRFSGTLNGGIYSTRTIPLTDSMGNEITDSDGSPLTIRVWDQQKDMHIISGVGNTDANGVWAKNRDQDCRSSLFLQLYGKIENIIFSNFRNVIGTTSKTGVNSYAIGVVNSASLGAVIENCHVRDSSFYARNRPGALVGMTAGAAINNCSVRRVSVNSFRLPNAVEAISLGALVGYAENSIISSCFAADVTVQALDVYDVCGIGGLVGMIQNSTVKGCYTTGTVYAASNRVGGVVGLMNGSSCIVTGCWSTASVQTVADFAGGIVGYHADGILSNNYTASTIMTRSFAADSVHRICSSTAYNEITRHDNFAYEGQYLTYTDPTQNQHNIYQFGPWTERDGATSLLTVEQLKDADIWENLIGIGKTYDLQGTARPYGSSNGTSVSSVAGGYMPKLVNLDTGVLLYDQPDVAVGKVGTSNLSCVYVGDANAVTESFTVQLVIYSDVYSDIGTAGPFSALADWQHMMINGAVVSGCDTPLDQNGAIYGVTDMGVRNDSSTNQSGRAFSFKLNYGMSAGAEGHYLDSYILSLTLNCPDGSTEQLHMRIGLQKPVYKVIYNISDWDNFFSNESYAQAYENIMIGWDASSSAGNIDFSAASDYSRSHGSHLYNVKVNRLSGSANPENPSQVPVIKNVHKIFSLSGQSLISQALTDISNLEFRKICLITGKNYGGDGKGIIAHLQGDMSNVVFEDVTIDGGVGSSVACIGRLYGEIDHVRMQNIHVTSYNSYIGGLVGVAYAPSTITDVSLSGSGNSHNTILSKNGAFTGGLVGRLDGLASGLSVTDTDITGRAYVGGAVGYANTDGGRPTERKLTDVTVGSPDAVSTAPGVTSEPSVRVTSALTEGVNYGEQRCIGGAVGSAGGTNILNINVYNTLVQAPQRIATIDYIDNGTYSYYIGGVVGAGGELLQSSLAKNVTVASYGGWCGGISGTSVGQYNTVEDCVIYGVSDKSSNVGGVIGTGGAVRSTAKHCVVIGSSSVGGVIGYQSGWARELGAIDCVVIGEKNVGGISGWSNYYHNLSNYVTVSLGETGIPQVLTQITDAMLPVKPADNNILDGAIGSYNGTFIKGITDVGGMMGRFTGICMRDSYVNQGVTVVGTENVGGLAGEFYGWYNDYYYTVSRLAFNCASGATINGGVNTGGLFGLYTRSPQNPSTPIASLDHPSSNFYGLLFTGNVTGDSNTSYMVGNYAYNPGDNGKDAYLIYSRLYENSTCNGIPAKNYYGEQLSYDYISSLPLANRTPYRSVLTLTASNLADPNIYFLGRDSTYGGMGWARTNWAEDAMQPLFAAANDPASFTAYQQGIVHNTATESSLKLWLDARNNTGNGYTDEQSMEWLDLSGNSNDASLHWNGDSGASRFALSQIMELMHWNRGALEFTGTNNLYYAELKQSLSPYLQQNYTVELIYTYITPAYYGYSSALSWLDNGSYGGFLCPYHSNGNYRNPAIYYGRNSAGTGWGNNPMVSKPFTRTASYVMGSYDEKTKKAPVSYYVNGVSVADANVPNISFIDTPDTSWRVGVGVGNNNMLRVCGVRVYDRVLTKEEVRKNSEYDAWYYFGGAKPSDAPCTPASLALDENGVTGTGNLMLIRSQDGNYNGTLVTSNFASGTPLGSRGYYYVTDGNGGYSNIVCRTQPGYGPLLRIVNGDNEYYSPGKAYLLQGQEGQNGSGTINSTLDRLYNGGYLLPPANFQDRSMRPLSSSSKSVQRKSAQSLPRLTAYASGIDTVNLELRDRPPEALKYTVRTGDQIQLEGVWPAESLTLSMFWDFSGSFTVDLECEGSQKSYTYSSTDLAKTVMTYGDGYQYLYKGKCYDHSSAVTESDTPFIHIMDGKILDSSGQIRSTESSEIIGSASSFSLTQAVPLWSGSVSGTDVSSFGTYISTAAGLQETQLIVKGTTAYTMPADGVRIGSFILDHYADSLYTTVLSAEGTMVDLGSPLTYPKDFSNSRIRELSCSLNSGSQMVLVRYESGLLVCFNYLTGETEEVLSEAKDMSFLSYCLNNIFNSDDSTPLSGSSRQALAAADYQQEVLSNPELQAALKQLEETESAKTAADQESVPDESDLPVGEETPGGEESGTDDSTPENEMEQAPVSDSVSDLKPGAQETDGTADTDPPMADPEGESEAADASEPPRDTSEHSLSASEPNSEPKSKPDSELDSELEGELEKTDEVPSETPLPACTSDKNASTQPLSTQYVTVYHPKTGESSVFSLNELLNKPAEKMISEDARAKKLVKMGFKTSLVTRPTATETEINGLALLLITALITTVLLVCMAKLKKRRLDRKDR